MIHPGRGALRTARGGILACCCTALAVMGHAAGGGGVPSLPTLVAVTALAGAGFSVLAQRRRHFGEIFAAALATQAAFHVAFSLGSAHAAPHARPIGHPTAHVVAHAWQPAHSQLAGLAMSAGHLAAAAAVAWLAAYGEATAWRLFRLVALVRLPQLGSVVVVRRPVLVPSRTQDHRAGESLSARVRPLRGPPAACPR